MPWYRPLLCGSGNKKAKKAARSRSSSPNANKNVKITQGSGRNSPARNGRLNNNAPVARQSPSKKKLAESPGRRKSGEIRDSLRDLREFRGDRGNPQVVGSRLSHEVPNDRPLDSPIWQDVIWQDRIAKDRERASANDSDSRNIFPETRPERTHSNPGIQAPKEQMRREYYRASNQALNVVHGEFKQEFRHSGYGLPLHRVDSGKVDNAVSIQPVLDGNKAHEAKQRLHDSGIAVDLEQGHYQIRQGTCAQIIAGDSNDSIYKRQMRQGTCAQIVAGDSNSDIYRRKPAGWGQKASVHTNNIYQRKPTNDDIYRRKPQNDDIYQRKPSAGTENVAADTNNIYYRRQTVHPENVTADINSDNHQGKPVVLTQIVTAETNEDIYPRKAAVQAENVAADTHNEIYQRKQTVHPESVTAETDNEIYHRQPVVLTHNFAAETNKDIYQRRPEVHAENVTENVVAETNNEIYQKQPVVHAENVVVETNNEIYQRQPEVHAETAVVETNNEIYQTPPVVHAENIVSETNNEIYQRKPVAQAENVVAETNSEIYQRQPVVLAAETNADIYQRKAAVQTYVTHVDSQYVTRVESPGVHQTKNASQGAVDALIEAQKKPRTKDQNRNKTNVTKTGVTPAPKRNLNAPDVITNTIAKTNAAAEISRLEALCEGRTKELNMTRLQLKSRITGFEAMTALVKYLTEELDAFSCPTVTAKLQDVQQQLSKVQAELDAQEEEKTRLAEELENIKAAHRADCERMGAEHRIEMCTLAEKMAKEKEEEVQAVIDKHSHEVKTLNSFHERSLRDMKSDHERQLTDKEKEHTEHLQRLKKDHEHKLKDLHKKHESRIEEISMRFEHIKVTLSEKVEFLRAECEDLRMREKTYMEKCQRDCDQKVQMALSSYKHLPAEIESLKAVMEMRNQEIHELRRQKLDYEKMLEELPPARDKIRALEQKVENLEAIINIKAEYEKNLAEKHQGLLRKFDRESKANKRLSMDNEELMWRLSQDASPDFHRSISHSPPNSGASTPEVIRRKKSPRGMTQSCHADIFFEKSPTNKAKSAGSNLRRSGTYDLLDKEEEEAKRKQQQKTADEMKQSDV